MIRELKLFDVLFGGDVTSVAQREKELNCAMALHNLIILDRADRLGSIPRVAPCPPNAHIITPSELPMQSIPTKKDINGADFPRHLIKFRDGLSVHARQMKLWLNDSSSDQIFSNRVVQRAKNLVNGANILQIAAHERQEGVWIVCGHVGASMKGVCYVSYMEIIIHSNIFKSACECTAGFVFHINWVEFTGELTHGTLSNFFLAQIIVLTLQLFS
jgi:hypothetical protein